MNLLPEFVPGLHAASGLAAPRADMPGSMGRRTRGGVFYRLLIVVALVCSACQAQGPAMSELPEQGLGFELIALAPGQVARLMAFNEAVKITMPGPAACRIALQFYDEQGQLLKELAVPGLEPGQSAVLELSGEDRPGKVPFQVRGVLAFGYVGGANPPALLLRRIATCNIVPTLEVRDRHSQKVDALMTDAKPLQGPHIPRE